MYAVSLTLSSPYFDGIAPPLGEVSRCISSEAWTPHLIQCGLLGAGKCCSLPSPTWCLPPPLSQVWRPRGHTGSLARSDDWKSALGRGGYGKNSKLSRMHWGVSVQSPGEEALRSISRRCILSSRAAPVQYQHEEMLCCTPCCSPAVCCWLRSSAPPLVPCSVWAGGHRAVVAARLGWCRWWYGGHSFLPCQRAAAPGI